MTLRRYTPLRAKTPLKTKSIPLRTKTIQLKRSGLRSTKPVPASALFKEEPYVEPGGKNAFEQELDTMRPAVYKRSGGYCEARIRDVCTGRALHVHHRLRRGQGGSNDLANLLDLCFNCHGYVHHHIEAAQTCGLLLKKGDDPEQKPIDRAMAMMLERERKQKRR